VEIAAIAAGVVVAFIVAGLAIWLVPRRQVAGWRRRGITDEVKLAELGVQARSSIVQALGGLALIVTLAVTISQVNETRKSADNNLRLSRQGQASERFSRAVEQLGSNKVDVRLGGLFSLARIGIDAPENAEPAFRLVATYVGQHYEVPKPLPEHGCQAKYDDVPVDVSTALRFALIRLAPAVREQVPEKRLLGLRGTKLSGIAIDNLGLPSFDLAGIRFKNALLQSANFADTNLTNAHFERACVGFASFNGATLVRAHFDAAQLKQADFRNADLTGASFRGARMKGAEFNRAALATAALSAAQKREIKVLG